MSSKKMKNSVGSDDYSGCSILELKNKLKALGCVATGSKDSLISRLQVLQPALTGTKRKASTAMKELPTKKAEAKTESAATAKSKVKSTKAATMIASKQSKKAAKTKLSPLQKSTKVKKSKLSGSHLDLGDLHSPCATLQRCLKDVPVVPVLKSVIGPGPCLLKALPAKASADTLRNMVEANEFECKASKAGGISLQHRLAIRLYTAEEPVPLYRVLNAPFHEQSRSVAKINNQAPFMRLLLQAVRALKAAGKPFTYSGPAYRGVRVASSPALKQQYENYATKFQVGNRLTFAAFTSLSLSDRTAENFGDQILFQFTRVKGVRIAAISAIPSELEILVEPPAVFEIKSCAKFHGVLSVVLESVDSPLKYL
eukprot:TRINITY_DN18145_c0_g2_i1.p1 TRINITY_DN18145_c0_g2~~TRINITY_DN18145_c0_g2_i1.p1  ORF type:complete len:370 (+),score=84.24 TRINITY_DN18145_c0_g2_i1:77-1186(+)